MKQVEVSWIFTPDDTETYAPVTGKVKLTVNTALRNGLKVGDLVKMTISELQNKSVGQLIQS